MNEQNEQEQNEQEPAKNRFEGLDSHAAVVLLGDIVKEYVRASLANPKHATEVSMGVGFVGIIFDIESGTANLMMLNPPLSPDLIYSKLHDLANGAKQQMLQFLQQQQQGRIQVAAAVPPGFAPPNGRRN